MSLFYRFWATFLIILSKTRLVKYPPFLIFDPYRFKVTGEEMERVLRSVKYGDVVLRGFTCYLHTKFIPSHYSHVGIVGSNNFVYHMTGSGVVKEHILDFLRCDRVCLLRPSKIHSRLHIHTQHAVRFMQDLMRRGVKYDHFFTNSDKRLYCFESVAKAYAPYSLRKFCPVVMGIRVKGRKRVYLPESFLESKHFERVLEFKHEVINGRTAKTNTPSPSVSDTEGKDSTGGSFSAEMENGAVQEKKGLSS